MARNKLFTSISIALLGYLAVAAIPGLSGAATAAPVPGEVRSGAIQQGLSQPPEVRKVDVPEIDVQESVRPAMSAPDSFKVHVNNFTFSGATAISSGNLLTVVADDIGKELSFADLLAVTDKVTAYYRKNGFLVARAYIPQQEISGGQIEIAILEGRIGGVTLTGADAFDSEVIAGTMASVKAGQILRGDNLERSLLLLNDMSGMQASASLAPGAGVGATNISISARPTPDYDYVFDVNNYGSQYTGRYRAGATINANNIGGRGDRLTLRGLMSEGFGTSFISANYSTPIDDYIPLHEWAPAWMNIRPGGTKFNISASRYEYEVGKTLSALGIRGSGTTVSLGLTHPFERSRSYNLIGQLRYDHKNLNETDFSGQTWSDDRLRVLSVGLSGDKHDHYMGGGLTTFNAALSTGLPGFFGGLNSRDPNASRQNAGGEFTKLMLEGARQQRITDIMSVYVRGAVQYSGYELVSNEQYSIGGPNGVRAYTQGTGLGDDAWLFSAEARWQMPTYELGNRAGLDSAQFVAFVDRGVSLIHNPLPGEDSKNDLGAIGIGLNLMHTDDISIKMSQAWTLNVGQEDPASNISDRRFWLQAVKWFD